MTESIVTIAAAVFASTGLWQFLGEWIRARYGKKTVMERLLIGIAHDRIHYLCKAYLKQGYMSEDDYDNLESIVGPYLEMGGNGSGKKLYEQARTLPIRHVQG